MSDPITLEDALAIKYLGKWDWSPDGRSIAYIWDDGGLFDLWLVRPAEGAPFKISDAKKGVSDLAWSSDGDLYLVQDGSLYRARIGTAAGTCDAEHLPAPEPIVESKAPIHGLTWSPDGALLAFGRDKKVWLWHLSGGYATELNLAGAAAPAAEGSGIVLWSPSSSKFAFAFRDEEAYRQIGVAKADGTVIWRSYFDGSVGGLAWFGDDTLYFARPGKTGTTADFYTLAIPAIDGQGAKPEPTAFRHVEGTSKGPVFATSAFPSPDESKTLFMLEDDGYAHYYLLDRTTGDFTQVTFGECEDFAHANDHAEWLPGSKAFLYASNKESAGGRRIHRNNLDSGTDEEIISLPGTNSMVKVSSDGRIAFQHCDEFRNMDIWVAGPNGEEPFQVTFSMPGVWTAENQSKPEEVSYTSNGGLTIHGYLLRPKRVPVGKKLPGLVWVHGGPGRQMRPGWNPMRSYALFHGFNQYLVSQGYVVLSVNYRGGIGYGRDFRQALYHKMGVDDVADVVGAGNYLKGLPFVDTEKVAVWGLSYGGYMTLNSLTQYPDVFRCGVNIAGIWDFPQWTKWADKRYGKGTGSFKVYFGGEPELSPDLYKQGSPRTFARNMKAPLLNVQGTADMNVDFPQMDRIVEDLVDLGKDFEVLYYPNEVHTFAKRKTWMDAMPKIKKFLDRNLLT